MIDIVEWRNDVSTNWLIKNKAIILFRNVKHNDLNGFLSTFIYLI